MSVFTECKNNSKTDNNLYEIKDTVNNADTEKAVKTLREFYLTFYGNDNFLPYENKILMEKYVSVRVLKRIDSLTADDENLILDYAPFIQGNDYFGNVVRKTLEIKPLGNDEYRVSFLQFWEKNEKRTNVDILLKKNNESNFQIYSILNDEYLNFKPEKLFYVLKK